MSVLLQPPFVLGLPTETVYGLAARIDEPRGIEAIFKIKERPFFDPLIVHISQFAQLQLVVSCWPQAAQVLVDKFWPGPLTLVLPKHPNLNPMITSGLNTVGVRWPKHPLALQIIDEEGVPLAAPSANKFGRTSPTTAEHVRQEFGSSLPVRDGGPCAVGLESTVLRIEQDESSVVLSLLRPGSVTREQIESCLDQANVKNIQWRREHERSLAPGQMKHHYMPKIPLVLVETRGLSQDQVLDQLESRFQELPKEIDHVEIRRPQFPIQSVFEIKLSQEPQLAAREFYSRLREASESNAEILLFYKSEIHQGVDWLALWDRLTKAASLRV